MSRHILTVISGLAILAAHLHCAAGHGPVRHVCQTNLAGSAVDPGTGDNQPIPANGDSDDCDRNFGCICKGATLGIAFAWISPANFSFLAPPAMQNPCDLVPNRTVTCEFPFWHTPGPVTALEICARFQSFQL